MTQEYFNFDIKLSKIKKIATKNKNEKKKSWRKNNWRASEITKEKESEIASSLCPRFGHGLEFGCEFAINDFLTYKKLFLSIYFYFYLVNSLITVWTITFLFLNNLVF
jgi:hypothetical protein